MAYSASCASRTLFLILWRTKQPEGERYRDLGGGTSELARWQGECADYREFDGLRVPTSARVSWLLKDGPFEYFRIQVTDLEYNASSPY